MFYKYNGKKNHSVHCYFKSKIIDLLLSCSLYPEAKILILLFTEEAIEYDSLWFPVERICLLLLWDFIGGWVM